MFSAVASVYAQGLIDDIDFSADIGTSRVLGDNTYNIKDFPLGKIGIEKILC